MSIGIYKITNKINNKCYIGQSVHIERRWTEHCLPSSNSLIANAIKKYGKENFNFEILENCFIEELNDLEEYYIQQYNTITPFGYNVLSYQEGRITANNIGIDILNAIFNDIENSTEPFINIAKKYGLSTRTIIRINLGQTHYNVKYSYPLRNKIEASICPICGERKTSKATICMACYKSNLI